MDCRLVESHEEGGDTIFVGQVESIGIGAGDPLLYERRGLVALRNRGGRCSCAVGSLTEGSDGVVAVVGARELSLEFCNLAQWVKIGYVYELRNSRYWRQTVSRASGRLD